MQMLILLLCTLTTTTSYASGPQQFGEQNQLPAVIARYERWRGGEAYRNLSGVHMHGRLSTGGLQGTIDTWATVKEQIRQDVDLGAFRQQTAVAQGQGWNTDLSGKAEKLSPSEVLDTLRDGELLFDGLLHGQAHAMVSSVPEEAFQGKPVDVLQVKFDNGSSYEYLVSQEGALLAIRATVSGRKTLTVFEEWRMVRGVRFPFANHVTGDAPSDASSTTVEELDLEPTFQDALFAAPRSPGSNLFPGKLASSGWLPFEYFGENRIFLPVMLNGHEVSAMLDSGASSTVIDRAFAESLGLQAKGQMTAEGAGGTSTMAVVEGTTLEIGGMKMPPQPLVALDLKSLEHRLGHPLVFILGNEVFQNSIVDIDFADHRIAFRDPGQFTAPADAQVVAAESDHGTHTIGVQIEGTPATLEFDLGNGNPLVLYPRFWERAGFLGSRKSSTKLSGGFGGTSIQKVVMVHSLGLASTKFGSIPAQLAGRESAAAKAGELDGNLGIPILSRFHLIVDFPHDRVLFAPPVDAAQPFRMNRSGFTLEPTDTGAKISYVAPGSPGEIAGLASGDTIIAVDGISVTQDKAKAYTWQYGVPGQEHLLTTSSGKIVSLRLEQLF